MEKVSARPPTPHRETATKGEKESFVPTGSLSSMRTLSLSPLELLEFRRLDEFSLDEREVVSPPTPTPSASPSENPKLGLRFNIFVGESGIGTNADADLETAVDCTRVAGCLDNRGLHGDGQIKQTFTQSEST